MPITVASFDIGYRNFSLGIERYTHKSIKDLQKRYNLLKKEDKIIERHNHTPPLKKILEIFYKEGETVLIELTDLNRGKTCGLQNWTRKNLAEYLESRKSLL